MSKRALISVFKKDGVADLARELALRGYEIVSTGGTAAELEAGKVKVLGVSKVTGFPEILDGRVKTLHPKIHGGILARRDLPEHQKALAEHGIPPVDIVVVNLYPFEDKVAKGASVDEAIENIDIGGPAMLRAAAKNFKAVAVVVDPADYRLLVEQLDRPGGIDAPTRLYFAQKAFRHTARYEAAIAGYLRPGRGAGGRLRRGRDRRRLPLPAGLELREDPGPALRREPPSARRFLQRPRLDPLLRGRGAQAPGEGAVVQQHPRPGRGLADRHRAGRHGLRDRQAHQSLRSGPGRDIARGLRAGLELRSDFGLRRDPGLQPARRRPHRARSWPACSWRP